MRESERKIIISIEGEAFNIYRIGERKIPRRLCKVTIMKRADCVHLWYNGMVLELQPC